MESKFHHTSHGFNKIQRHLYHKHIIGMMYIVHQSNCLIENIKFMFFMKKIYHILRVVENKIFQHSSINKIETNLRVHNFLLLLNFFSKFIGISNYSKRNRASQNQFKLLLIDSVKLFYAV